MYASGLQTTQVPKNLNVVNNNTTIYAIASIATECKNNNTNQR